MPNDDINLHYTKFCDGLTRFELSQEIIHDIAQALMAQAHNPHCAPDYGTHCYRLGRMFMDVWTERPRDPFAHLGFYAEKENQ